eukprot:Trichotokara_eunicae@DN5858_c0_g1_i3.p1
MELLKNCSLAGEEITDTLQRNSVLCMGLPPNPSFGQGHHEEVLAGMSRFRIGFTLGAIDAKPEPFFAEMMKTDSTFTPIPPRKRAQQDHQMRNLFHHEPHSSLDDSTEDDEDLLDHDDEEEAEEVDDPLPLSGG